MRTYRELFLAVLFSVSIVSIAQAQGHRGAAIVDRSEHAAKKGTRPQAENFFYAHAAERVDDEETPLAGRVAVVLVHGYGKPYEKVPIIAGTYTWTGLTNALASAREVDPSIAEDMKLFYYHYRPVKPYPELASEFADRLVEELLTGPDAARKVVFVAHSAGTLMSRYAAADPRIQPRVAGIFTLAGVHRGSVQASLVTARNMEQRPGMGIEQLEQLDTLRTELGMNPLVMDPDPKKRMACQEDVTCAVLESLAFDNFDGSITAEDIARYGMIENTYLAAFNRSDPNVDRIYAYHGHATDLGEELEKRPVLTRLSLKFGRGEDDRKMVPTQREMERRLVSAINPRWSTADPLVTYESGLFEASPDELAGRAVYENIDHKAILWDIPVQTQLASDLVTLVRLAKLGQELDLLGVLRSLRAKLERVATSTSEMFGYDDLFVTE